MSGKDEAPPTVGQVSIKLPPLWSTNPQIWFSQVEVYNFQLETSSPRRQN